ncbi:EAL domain-containing protein [Aquisalimonas lutea]|uniref:putative bifunctional diguanylate cyclase/phosphodiesterase n=1 Tax=Aquisalimonas lutea TaxID=1327750 RepID=UPI0025B60B31|nr:EAL domain-containing protein [Aquisalimonas lutea]MDN3519555.1 EAL domain-containing protein [Aquisalimonas lutea]
MTAGELAAEQPPGIAAALANTANSEVLEHLLGERFRVCHHITDDGNHDLHDDVDLVVVDIASLRRNYDLLLELRRRADPMVLPVLLVVDRHTRPHSRITAELGHSVDDILRIPTSQAELQARINNLLRLRTLSRAQDNVRQQLEGVVSALRTLNACDNVVVRSKTEEELLGALCRTIIDEEGYSLALVGFETLDGSDSVEICASAGPSREFIKDLRWAWDNGLVQADTLHRAVRTGQTQIVGDVANEITSRYIRERALAHRLATVITLPLRTDTVPRGCLTIWADTPGHFGREERQLLERLADNLVFGLNALRIQREREQQAAEIQYLAYTDALTELPNRRHLVDYLDSVLRGDDAPDVAGALLFIDLDGFKLINDALGHEVGDQVLRQAAHRLQAAVRDSDLVARQGGDEFLVVIVDAPRDGAAHDASDIVAIARALAERIIAHLSEPLTAGGYKHTVKASVGISLFPEHGRDAAMLIEKADKAMYEAKKRGGTASHVFSEALSASRQQRFSMEARLRQALEGEEFTLHYQPIFELDSCRIRAVEALIRWPQGDGEVLMPGAFMPVVEETGLIHPLSDWVLETAARQMGAWHERGVPLDMAVNLSMKQLSTGVDAERFAALVRPHIDPCRMHLEVTENALMADPAAVEKLLADLHDQGFQIAIDDFGTGYSSLSRLQHLPIQTLKIDRSFVRELGQTGSKGAVLVALIQQMAARMELHTIAEGIETDDQRRLLMDSSTGGGWGQGFWMSPAIPPDDVEKLLGRRPPAR